MRCAALHLTLQSGQKRRTQQTLAAGARRPRWSCLDRQTSALPGADQQLGPAQWLSLQRSPEFVATSDAPGGHRDELPDGLPS
jgi:hypothetical protein